jgi:CBS domain-containing protein
MPMLVKDLMTPNTYFCTVAQTAADAARRMWDFDIGCIPVVDDHRVPVGVVTDRDICMATYTQDKPPSEIPLQTIMSREIHTCRPSDRLSAAEQTMQMQQVRRLPVVDEQGKLIGMLSLNDLALASMRSTASKLKERIVGDVSETLAAVCRHRPAPIDAQL